MAQKGHEGDDRYQFVDETTVETILKHFSLYYAEFAGSSVQKLFLEERRLSGVEAARLADLAAGKEALLSKSDRAELGASGIHVKESTMPDTSATGIETMFSISLLELLIEGSMLRDGRPSMIGMFAGPPSTLPATTSTPAPAPTGAGTGS